MIENKICEKCHTVFMCKSYNIKECFCTSINMTAADREAIKALFKDCLCSTCLHEMKEISVKKSHA